MEYNDILAALNRHKELSKAKWDGIKTVKDGVHHYTYKGVTVRVIYTAFDEKTGEYKALLRRHANNRSTWLKDFESGGTETYALSPDELSTLPNAWELADIYHLTDVACDADSMSARHEAQKELERLYKLVVPYLGSLWPNKNDDVTGWAYDSDKNRVIRPWEDE